MSPRTLPDAHTMGTWLVDSTRRSPRKVAVDDRGVRVTYADLERRSDALAQALRRAGYGTGDRVATLCTNSADHVVLFFACAKAGLVLVPLSWRLTVSELGPVLATARPALLLADPELQRHARQALERAGLDVPLSSLGSAGVEGTVPTRVLAPGKAWPAQREPHDDDPLLVIFTSGSEAAPKGAVLSHANCFWTNLAIGRTTGISADDVVLATLPQFHVAAWNCQPVAAWGAGATVVLESTFDPARVLCLVADREVTTTMTVPTQLQQLMGDPTFADADLSSLRHVLVGGAAVPPVLRAAWAERGVAVAHGYGLTEAAPNVLHLPAVSGVEKPEAVGWPYPSVEVRLVDTEGAVLEGAATGELQVRGPNVFLGYLHDPAATARAFTDDGWLRTGDLVARDADGCHRVVDRLKHIYISGGENVAPAEVETVLLQHVLVADAAVVAVPDETWGEVGVAFVEPVAGVGLSAEEVLAHARTHLARYKVPREVHLVDALPRTGIGKIARADLRRGLLPSGTPTTPTREDDPR